MLDPSTQNISSSRLLIVRDRRGQDEEWLGLDVVGGLLMLPSPEDRDPIPVGRIFRNRLLVEGPLLDIDRGTADGRIQSRPPSYGASYLTLLGTVRSETVDGVPLGLGVVGRPLGPRAENALSLGVDCPGLADLLAVCSDPGPRESGKDGRDLGKSSGVRDGRKFEGRDLHLPLDKLLDLRTRLGILIDFGTM